MNDDYMLAAMRSSLTSVKDSLADVHMDQPPEAIIARARGRRLRRGLPAVVGAGGLAIGLGVALTLPGGSAGARAVHVNLDAWTVNTTSGGQVDVTIRQLKDPARLSQTLADAGIPVRLTSGRVCGGTPEDEQQLSQVLHKVAEPGEVMLTIDPAAMPAGKELVIGIGFIRQGPVQGPAAAFTLIKAGAPMDCGSGTTKTGGAPDGAKTSVQ